MLASSARLSGVLSRCCLVKKGAVGCCLHRCCPEVEERAGLRHPLASRSAWKMTQLDITGCCLRISLGYVSVRAAVAVVTVAQSLAGAPCHFGRGDNPQLLA